MALGKTLGLSEPVPIQELPSSKGFQALRLLFCLLLVCSRPLSTLSCDSATVWLEHLLCAQVYVGGEGWYGQTWIDTHVDPPPQDIILLGIPSLSSPYALSVLGELGAIKRPQTPVWGKQSLSQTPPAPWHQGQKVGTEAGKS